MNTSRAASELNLDPGTEPEKRIGYKSRAVSASGWLALALLAALCIYRIAVFSPLPLDSPGTLRPVLYGWFQLYTGAFESDRDAFFVFQAVGYLSLLSFPLLAALNHLRQRNSFSWPYGLADILCSRWVFWLSYAVSLAFCRFPVLLMNELNPDEGEFLASAYKLFYDPNFFHSVDCHTSGPGNMFPLMWPAIFGVSPDFVTTRIVGLAAIFLSVYLLYRAIALVAGEDLARIGILPVAAVFPTFRNSELVYYSSEHVPILLVSLALFLSVRIFARPARYRVPAFLLGLVACLAVFTKVQSLPIIAAAMAVVLAFLCASFGLSASWRTVMLFAAGAVPPMLFNAALCIRAGVWDDFWQSYIVSNVEYVDFDISFQSSMRSFLEFANGVLELRLFLITVLAIALAAVAHKLRPGPTARTTMLIRILATGGVVILVALIRREDRLLIYGFAGLAVLCLVPAYFLYLYLKGCLDREPLRWFGLLALLSTGAACFSVYKAHRTFVHYLLFLFVPFGTLLAWTLVRHSRNLKLMPFLTAGAAFGCAAYLWSFQDNRAFEIADMIRAPEGDLIRTLTHPGGHIYVWGWTAHPYLGSGRVSSTRQTEVGTLFRSYNVMTSPPAFHPTPSSEKVSAYYRSRELRDLESNPPELFIDAVGPRSWFLSNRDYFGFERVPAIARFVDANYVHLIDLYDERYFLRRDLAKQR